MSPPAEPGDPRPHTPTLDDRYQLETGRIFLTGVQALVRLPFDQARRDRAAGLRTGTFVSGYPGSPLGGYDLALAQTGAAAQALDLNVGPASDKPVQAMMWLVETVREEGAHCR